MTLLENRKLTFIIKKSVATELLRHVSHSVATRPGTPALANIYASLSKDTLRFVTSDLATVSIATTEDITIVQGGTGLIPAKQFTDVVNQLPKDGTVEVAVIDDTVSLSSSDGGRWEFPEQSVKDFPKIDLKASFTRVDPLEFTDAITYTRVAASKDAQRQNLMAVEIVGKKVTSCDAARLQQYKMSAEFPFDICLPTNKLSHVLRVAEQAKDVLAVAKTDKHFILTTGVYTFAIAMNSVTFPNVEQAILRPAMTNKTTLRADRSELIKALNQVRIATDDFFQSLRVDVRKTEMTLSTRTQYGARAESTVGCSWSGDPRTIIVNCNHLLEILETHSDQEVHIKLADDTKTFKSALLIDNSKGTSVLQQVTSEW